MKDLEKEQELNIDNFQKGLSFDGFEVDPIDKDGDFEVQINHRHAYHYLTTEQAKVLIAFLQKGLNSR